MKSYRAENDGQDPQDNKWFTPELIRIIGVNWGNLRGVV